MGGNPGICAATPSFSIVLGDGGCVDRRGKDGKDPSCLDGPLHCLFRVCTGLSWTFPHLPFHPRLFWYPWGGKSCFFPFRKEGTLLSFWVPIQPLLSPRRTWGGGEVEQGQPHVSSSTRATVRLSLSLSLSHRGGRGGPFFGVVPLSTSGVFSSSPLVIHPSFVLGVCRPSHSSRRRTRVLIHDRPTWPPT